MPHTPDYLSIKQNPIVYDPTLKPKLFWNFLKDVLYPTEIKQPLRRWHILLIGIILMNIFQIVWIWCKWKKRIYRPVNRVT